MNHRNWVIFLQVFFLISAQLASGQVGIIQDDDGYVNVRQEATGQSEVIARLHDGDVFWYYEDPNSSWYEVSFTLDKVKGRDTRNYTQSENLDGQKITVGYMHKSRILSLSSLKDIAERTSVPGDLELKSGTYDLMISYGKFEKADHEIQYYKDSPSIVRSIDGKNPKGVDGNLPAYGISSLNFTWGKEKVPIPQEAYRDLFQPNIEGIELKTYKGYVYLTMLGNSDGAGAYDCVWIFKDKQFLERYVNTP